VAGESGVSEGLAWMKGEVKKMLNIIVILGRGRERQRGY